MEQLPNLGKLLEFTFEAETRPMITQDHESLTRMQDIAAFAQGMSDPVFGLDESLGSVSAVFQTYAVSAQGAAVRGTGLFLELLSRAGVSNRQDILEHVHVEIFMNDSTNYVSLDGDGDTLYAGGRRT